MSTSLSTLNRTSSSGMSASKEGAPESGAASEHIENEAAAAKKSHPNFHIGELAKRTGKSKRALRLYEEMGLLAPSSRSSGGFRLFDDDALEQVRWIGNLQELGLSLQDMQAVVENAKKQVVPRDSMETVRSLLQERLDDIQAQIGRLNVLRRDLKHTLRFLEDCRGCGVENDGATACLSCGCQNQNTPPLLRGISRCASPVELLLTTKPLSASETQRSQIESDSSSVEVHDVHN
ncbi:MAG: MerR family transcriptional regulator [Deltaproteobacteria bacterium]|nr:MerR family transcriptional regulator [Deltaproteobacteria bacterium]